MKWQVFEGMELGPIGRFLRSRGKSASGDGGGDKKDNVSRDFTWGGFGFFFFVGFGFGFFALGFDFFALGFLLAGDVCTTLGILGILFFFCCASEGCTACRGTLIGWYKDAINWSTVYRRHTIIFLPWKGDCITTSETGYWTEQASVCGCTWYAQLTLVPLCYQRSHNKFYKQMVASSFISLNPTILGWGKSRNYLQSDAIMINIAYRYMCDNFIDHPNAKIMQN